MTICLHCEISEILLRRQEAGETCGPAVYHAIAEVLGDMLASAPEAARVDLAMAMQRAILKVFGEVLNGTYKPGSTPQGLPH